MHPSSIRRRCLEYGSKCMMMCSILLLLSYTIYIIGSPRIISTEYLQQQIQQSSDAEFWKNLFIRKFIAQPNSTNLSSLSVQKAATKILDLPVASIIDENKNIKNANHENSVKPLKRLPQRLKKKDKLIVQKESSQSVIENIDVMSNVAGATNSSLPVRINPKHVKNYAADVVIDLGSEWNSKKAKEREKVFKSRNKRLRQECKKRNWRHYHEPQMIMMDRFLRWSTQYNLLWCPIFKSASTTWVKNFLSLAGEDKVDGSLHGRVRQLYGPPADQEKKQQLLTSAMKFIIVRHPLERILSAYRDKMLRILRKDDPYHKMQIQISEKYKDPYIPEKNDITSKHKAEQPSFNQFLLRVKDDMIQHTTTHRRKILPINLHWRPYWTTCAPCQMNYDVIGKVETSDEDQEYIIHEAHLEGLAFNAHTHASNFDSYNGTSEATRAYYSSVPRSLLQEIVDLYKPDFDIFDYSAEEYLEMAVPGI